MPRSSRQIYPWALWRELHLGVSASWSCSSRPARGTRRSSGRRQRDVWSYCGGHQWSSWGWREDMWRNAARIARMPGRRFGWICWLFSNCLTSWTPTFFFESPLWALEDGTLQDAQNLEASPIFKALATHASHWDVETFSVELVPLADVMQPMGCFLEGATGLSSLMLRQCGLTGPGAAPLKFLCETLVSLPFKNLLTLDLSMNALCLEGANFLGEFLQCTPQLQTLLLGGNGLGPAGLAALVRSLSQLPLSTLDLSLNGLGTTGVETLLPAGLQLQSLNLRGNWFGSSHSEIIVHLLQSMSATLVKLDISRPGLKGSGRSWPRVRGAASCAAVVFGLPLSLSPQPQVLIQQVQTSSDMQEVKATSKYGSNMLNLQLGPWKLHRGRHVFFLCSAAFFLLFEDIVVYVAHSWVCQRIRTQTLAAMVSRPVKEVGAAMVAATAVPTALNWTDVIKTRMQGENYIVSGSTLDSLVLQSVAANEDSCVHAQIDR